MRVILCLVLFGSAAGCTRSGPPPGAGQPAGGGQQPQGETDPVARVGEFQGVYNDYASNPAAAAAQYAGRVIEGVLRVDAIDVGQGKARLTQHTALTGDAVDTLRPDPSKGVTAAFDDPGQVTAAKTGSRLRIRCEVQGYAGGVLTLHRCQIVEAHPPPAEPQAGGPLGRPSPGGGAKKN